MAPAKKEPAMIFRNYGGVYHLQIGSAEELALIDKLEPARWAADSAPLADLRCDPVMLSRLDPENRGRLRTRQLSAAREWLYRRLSGRDRLAAGLSEVRLNDLDDGREEGKKLRDAAEMILEQLHAPDRTRISLQQVRAFRVSYAGTLPNGDGVVPPEAAEDEETRQLLREVVRCTGGAKDASGLEGVTAEKLDEFLDRAEKYLAWKARGETVRPWGAETEAAAALVAELDPILERFFRQCDLVRLDERAAARLKPREADLEAVGSAEAASLEKILAAAPPAAPNPGGTLPLDGPFNPYYEPRLVELRETVLRRALDTGENKLTRDSWRRVKAVFAEYPAWRAEPPASDEIQQVGDEQLAACRAGAAPKKVRALIAADKAVADELARVDDLEKLLLLHAGLMRLANNFVSFPHLYDPAERALFERGKLILDGRELAFTVRVENPAEHKKIAAAGGIFLVYAEIADHKDGGEKFVVAAAVTSGVKGGIEIGKRGVFFDVRGREWDARVVDVVAHPISMWEAAKAPFQKVSKLVSRQVEKFAATKTEAFEKTTGSALDKKDAAAPPGASTAAAVRDLLLGGGIALAALGSSLAYVAKTLAGISLRDALLVPLGIVAAVAGVSAAAGWFKLRRRDLRALLEAGGWAINLPMPLTGRLGRLFTRTATLPKNAVRKRRDLVRGFLRELGESEFSWRRVGLGVLLVLACGALYYQEEVAFLLR